MKDKSKRVVLAYGESTGHAHAFYGEDTVELNNNKLTVYKEDSLDHEEHTSHVVKPLSPTQPAIGDVTTQREYDMGVIRKVID